MLSRNAPQERLEIRDALVDAEADAQAVAAAVGDDVVVAPRAAQVLRERRAEAQEIPARIVWRLERRAVEVRMLDAVELREEVLLQLARVRAHRGRRDALDLGPALDRIEAI